MSSVFYYDGQNAYQHDHRMCYNMFFLRTQNDQQNLVVTPHGSGPHPLVVTNGAPKLSAQCVARASLSRPDVLRRGSCQLSVGHGRVLCMGLLCFVCFGFVWFVLLWCHVPSWCLCCIALSLLSVELLSFLVFVLRTVNCWCCGGLFTFLLACNGLRFVLLL